MKKPSVPVLILLLGSATVILLWLGWALLELKHPVEKWGVFGDKFGALNCLFTGLAMVGVVAALWHEREQVALRDKEHADLIQEMRRQVEGARLANQIAAIETGISTCADLIREKPNDYGAHEILTKRRNELRDQLGEILKNLTDGGT